MSIAYPLLSRATETKDGLMSYEDKLFSDQLASVLSVSGDTLEVAGDVNTTNVYLASAQQGTANGLATLGGDGKLSSGQIPSGLVGALVYQGTWNATTNSPSLSSGTGTKGYYYKVATAGTHTLDGISVWNIGDLAVFDGTVWDKIDGTTDEVITFNGRYGVVVPVSGDYTLSQVTATFGAGLTFTSGSNTLVANVTSVLGRTGAVVATSGDYNLSQITATFGAGLTFNSGSNTLTANVTSVAGRTGAVTLAYADISGLGTAAQHTATDFDSAGAAATAQSNAEAFATSADSTVLATAESFATSADSTVLTSAETYASNGSNITSGTVAAARIADLSATYILVSLINANSGVAGLDSSGDLVGPIINYHDTASNLASVVLLAGQLAWATDTQWIYVGDGSTAGGLALAVNATNISTGTLPAGRIPAPTASARGGILSNVGSPHNWVSGLSGDTLQFSRPAFSDLSGSASASQIPGPAAQSISYASSITPVGSYAKSVVNVGTLTGAITINAPSGTPLDGGELIFRIVQDGTGSRVITWDSAFAFGTDITTAMLPTAASSKYELKFVYNATDSKWRALGLGRGF